MDKNTPLVGAWWGLVLSVLSGLLFYASFPGLDIWPLAFIAFTPWIIALRGRTVKGAALQGLVIGLVLGVFGFYWLLDMLQVFSGFPTWLCAVFMGLLVAYQAGRYALTGALVAAARNKGWPVIPVFLAAIAAGEQVYPMLFHFTFAGSAHQVYPLLQVAELGGPIAVVMLLVAPSLLFGRLLEEKWALRRAGRPSGLGAAFHAAGRRQMLALVLVPSFFCCYGVVRIAQVDEFVAQAQKIRVGVAQANMSLGEKRTNLKEGLARHLRITRKLVEKDDVDLVVWPETSVAGATLEEDAPEYYHKAVTGKLGVPAIVGAVLARRGEEAKDTVFFNSALIADGSGRIRGRYDKQFLLAFGEYLPFGERFPKLYEWSPNSSRFKPGTSFEPLYFGDHPLAVFICYEDLHASFVNKMMRSGRPELLVNMTNDAWFGDTTEPWEHMALSKLRAVEQRRYFIRATNSGVSGIVDPVGRLVAKTPTFEEARIAEDVALLQLPTVYRAIGDVPWWIVSGLSFLMALVRRRPESALSAPVRLRSGRRERSASSSRPNPAP